MKYNVYIGMRIIAGSTQTIEVEIDDDATEDEIEEICRNVAFEEIDWGYEKEDDDIDSTRKIKE